MSRRLSRVDAREIYVADILYGALAEECEGDPEEMVAAWKLIREEGDRFFAKLGEGETHAAP